MGSFKCLLVSLLLLAAVDSVICRDAPSSPKKVFTPFFDAEGNPAHGPPVATLQVSDGTVVDCVPIEQQISAHLPSLKGRPVQPKTELPPDHQPLSGATPCQQLFQQEHGACPEGTVAVARAPKQGSWSSLVNHRRQLAATSNTSSDGTVSVQIAPDIIIDIGFANVDFEWAGSGADFGGMGATMSLQQPYVEPSPTEGIGSGARIMYNIAFWKPGATSPADIGGAGFISAGFLVNPAFGDSVPRFYTFWGLTVPYSKEAKGNCFNMDCPGYTHVSSSIVLGGPMTGTEFSLFIQLDEAGKCNLLSGTQLVGFWDFAETLGWRWDHFVGELKLSPTAAFFSGGLVAPIVTAGRVTTTHMGTGKYPHEGGAAYMRNIVWQSNVDRLYYQVPLTGGLASPTTTQTVPRVCYDAYVGSSVEWGTYLLYGGRAGQNPACHL